MIDPPKRLGYRLTYDAECLYNDWQEIGGCSCHTGGAPCSSCHNEGHPISLEENDEAWELDYTIEDVYNAWKLKQEKESMSRTEIKDKGGTQPKSEWFGFKYRVTPESSKLLQEAVFKDGGEWLSGTTEVKELEATTLFVKQDGKICIATFDMPEKQPPQPEKVFKVGKWYKCVDAASGTHALTEGNYYKCTWVSSASTSVGVDSNTMKDSRGWMIDRFDINSESDYDSNAVTLNVGDKVEVTSNMSNGNTEKPTFLTSWLIGDIVKIVAVCRNGKYTNFKCNKDGCDYSQELSQYQLKKVVAKDVKESKLGTPKAILEAVNFVHDFKPNDFSITKEEVNMSNQNRVVSVKFFDDDAGLKAENSLVASYEITTRANDAMTVNKLLMREDIAGDIDLHNAVRASTVDATILKNTGNKVFLQPIDFEDLRVEVRQV